MPLPFHTTLKIPLPIDTFLYISLCALVWMRQSLCVCVCVCVCVCWSMWVSLFVMVSHVDKAWICSAEKFLELYGKVEAVVRNCLLSWSGHLFEVPSTHIFDKCFCFKHISLVYAPIGAFFRWYIHICIYYFESITIAIEVFTSAARS